MECRAFSHPRFLRLRQIPSTFFISGHGNAGSANKQYKYFSANVFDLEGFTGFERVIDVIA